MWRNTSTACIRKMPCGLAASDFENELNTGSETDFTVTGSSMSTPTLVFVTTNVS